MPFKTITIKRSVYDSIKRHKKKNESFSDLFARTFEEKGDVWKYFGAAKLTEKELTHVKGRMSAFRKSFDSSAKERANRALSRL